MDMSDGLFAPFPYFGGKRKIASVVWQALGQPKHYIEPFCGSCAVLLLRPDYDPQKHIETVNDADGHIANVWRALQFAPDEVAKWCDWPVNHADLTARRNALNMNTERLLENLCNDDKWYDPIMAGYYIWAASCWIGSELICPGQIPNISDGGKCAHSIGKIPRIGHSGEGIHAISKRRHIITGGKGIHAVGQIPYVADGVKGVQDAYNTNIYEWFRRLSERLRYVRVVCGDWMRVCGGNWQDNMGTCGIFFDPPYSHDTGRDLRLYANELNCAKEVAEWAYERGKRETYRIVLAGYEGEHDWLEKEGWRVYRWKARGGYSNIGNGAGKHNRHRERLWLSPYCQNVDVNIPLFVSKSIGI